MQEEVENRTLTLVVSGTTTLIANTKGEGKAGDDFWVKAETLLYCALIGYIWHFLNRQSPFFRPSLSRSVPVSVSGALSISWRATEMIIRAQMLMYDKEVRY